MRVFIKNREVKQFIVGNLFDENNKYDRFSNYFICEGYGFDTSINDNTIDDDNVLSFMFSAQGITTLSSITINQTNTETFNLSSFNSNESIRLDLMKKHLTLEESKDCKTWLTTIDYSPIGYGYETPLILRGIASKHLVKAKIGKGFKRIDANAFHRCESLQYLTIDNIETLDSACLSGAPMLRYLTVRRDELQTNSTIPNNFCSNCQALEEVEIIGKYTGLGNNAFANCNALRLIKLPESIGHIQSTSLPVHFHGVLYLTSHIPPSIDSGLFYSVNLSAVTISIPKDSYLAYSTASGNWSSYVSTLVERDE